MIKNIIFDLGGVILDIDFDRTANAFKSLGINNFEVLYSKATQSKLFENLEKGNLSPDEFRQEIRSLTSINISDFQINEAWNAILLDFSTKRLKLLQEIAQNYNCYLLSNTNIIHYQEYQKNLRENHNIDGLESFFKKAYFSHEIGMRKPDKNIYEFILSDSKLNAEETLFIDDSIQNIQSAQKIGIKTLFIDIEKEKEITHYFNKGILTQNEKKIEIEQTSSQKFFTTNKTEAWKNEVAPIIVGIGIRNPANIGGLIRLAGAVGCKELLLTGSESDFKISKIKKTATTGFNKVDWKFVDIESWEKHIPEDYEIIALETTANSETIYKQSIKSKTAIVVGDERFGIDLKNIAKCNKVVYIPLNGPVSSLNVVQAASIALFEILRQEICN